MNNKKVFFFVVLGFFILSLAAAVYFSYSLWLKTKLQTNVVITPKVEVTGGSIVKQTLSSGEGFTYLIEGSFESSLEKYGSIGLLRGGFVVKGDSSNQKIPAYLGDAMGSSNLGIYTGSFQGSSTWAVVKTDTLLGTIKPGDPVMLRISYNPAMGSRKDNYSSILQNVLDSFSDAINKGSEYRIPVDFFLATESLGIIK